MDNDKKLKTGTTTVGLICKDGVVLAADKRATAGNLIVNKRAKKVVSINDRMALTKSGMVSDSQLLIKLLKSRIKLKELNNNRRTTVKEAASQLAGMVYSNVRMAAGITHFLFGGFDKKGPQIFDIFPDGSITDINTEGGFVASGSGSVFAYGVLENNFKENMTVKEGVDLALSAVNAALQRDSASGQGIDIAVIDKNGFRKEKTKMLNTSIKN